MTVSGEGTNCSACGHANPERAKFCSECGEPLRRSCMECGAALAPGAKFCGECGAPVDDAAAGGRPLAAAVDVATRKQVTALFADLVGSTAFGESVDGEVARAALADYFELLESTIETHAGYVAKFTGDGIMAVFGLPAVAEDDALRAVAAARELQRRFTGFAERVRARYGAELGLRVGVNTGELVVGDGDADLVGDVLNTAARLEAACAPGGVLVGEETWRLTRSSVVYEMAGDIRAKGKAEPVATFAVVGAASVEADETPFVGRSAQLAALLERVDEVRESGRPRLVTVIGAPGMGKTRLAAELRAASGARSFDLRIERRGSTTFSPVVDLLRSAAGSVDTQAIDGLIGDQPDTERLTTVLSALVGTGTVASTEEAFWAVRRLVEELAADEPIVLVIDDIQWAEPLFWDLLEHVAEWASGAVLLLALARPELRELRPELTQSGRVVAPSIDLEGLDSDMTVELARSLLDGEDMPGDLVDRLPSSTDGNPLFVRELVRMLVDDGVLARTDDGWTLTVDVEAVDVPPTVLSLLASRVERLPDDERELLELASVIGTEFDRGALIALASGDRSARVGALLDRLRRKDLVHPSGAWAGDDPLYRFHHVLLRDAAYRRLLKARRAELHERLARYVVERSLEGADETDLVAALHFEQAHRFRTELGESGPDVDALAGEAVRRLAAAAERALDRDDLRAASGYAVRALSLDDGGPGRDELLVLGCEAMLALGDAMGAEALVDELAERSGDARSAAWADCFRAQRWTLTDSSRLDEAAAIADHAAQRLTDAADDAGVAKARLVRAAALARLGRVGDCEHELDLALGAARTADDRRSVAAVLGATPLAALWGPSPAARAGGRCLDVLRLLHITTASPGVEATSYRCQGLLEALRGRFDSARTKLDTSRETARELGLRQGMMETELFAGMVELLAADPRTAERHLETAVAGLGELGIGADAGQARALLALAVLQRGDIDRAESLAVEARNSAGQNLRTAIASAAALGEVRAAQGRHDEAEALIGEAIALGDPTDVVLDRSLALASGASVARIAGDDRLAAERLAAARRLVDDKGSQHWIGVSVSEDVGSPASAFDPVTAPVVDASGVEQPPPLDVETDVRTRWRRIGERQTRLGTAGSVDGFRATFTDDFEYVDHRSLGQGRLGPDEYAATLSLIEGSITEATETVKVDHHRLLAVEHTKLPDGSEFDRLMLVRLAGDLIEGLEHFDLPQRDEAIARFDELAASTRAESIQSVRVSDDAAASQRVGEVDMTLFDAAEYARSRGFEDCAALLETFGDSDEWIVAASGATAWSRRQLVDVRALARRACLVEWTADLDGTGTSKGLSVLGRTEDGLLEIDDYDLIAAPDAIVRFGEVAGEPGAGGELSLQERRPLSSQPDWIRALDAMRTAFASLDPERFVATLTDDFVRLDHRQITEFQLDRSEFTEFLMGDAMVMDFRHERMVRLDDELLLAEQTVTAGGFEWPGHLTIVGRSGHRIARFEFFDAEQLDEAIKRYDTLLARRTLVAEDSSELGPTWRPLLDAIKDARSTADQVQIRQLLSDDFELTDHRSLSWGRMNADEYASTIGAETEGARTETGDVVRVNVGQLMFVDRSMFGDGDLVERILVFERRDGLLCRIDVFGLDQRAEAEALLRTTSSSPIASNEAWRVVQAIAEGWRRGDVKAVRAQMGDGYTSQRVDSLDIGRVGADDHIALISEYLGESDIAEYELTLLATRGDRLCAFSLEAPSEIGEIRRAAVMETHDGRALTTRWFVDADLSDLRAVLDERAIELGLLDPALIERADLLNDAILRRDPEALREHCADGFELIDHRPLGFDRLDLEGWIQLEVARPTGVVHHFVEAIRHEPGLSLSVLRAGEVDDVEWWMIHLHQLDPNERFSRLEIFGLDQRADAIARFEELRPGTSPEGTLANDAAIRLERALLNGLPRELRLVQHGDERLDVSLTDAESVEVEVLAIRDDDLCLARCEFSLGGGGATAHLVVAETGEGQIVRVDVFDESHLDAAADRLDRRWAESSGLNHAHVTVTMRELGYGPQGRELLTDDFEMIDHKPLGLGRLGPDEWMATTSSVEDVTAFYHRDFLHADGRVSLAEIRAVTADGSEWASYQLATMQGDLVHRWEVFALEQRDEALARLEELLVTDADDTDESHID